MVIWGKSPFGVGVPQESGVQTLWPDLYLWITIIRRNSPRFVLHYAQWTWVYCLKILWRDFRKQFRLVRFYLSPLRFKTLSYGDFGGSVLQIPCVYRRRTWSGFGEVSTELYYLPLSVVLRMLRKGMSLNSNKWYRSVVKNIILKVVDETGRRFHSVDSRVFALRVCCQSVLGQGSQHETLGLVVVTWKIFLRMISDV